MAVRSTDEDNASSVFETLNDRGIGLSTPDLLRTLLLRRANTDAERDEIIDLWETILAIEDEASVQSFLRHYWLSQYGDIKTHALYREIKQHLAQGGSKYLFMQRTMTQSNAEVLLFPEHVVNQWTEATEAFWRDSLNNLARRHATLIIGAGLPRSHARFARGYYNALIARTERKRAIYYQRIPVPIAMWKPFADDGVPINLFGPGTIPVQNERAAVLICYEQLLVWPFLSSAFEHPTILITAANDYWAKRTPIPKIQETSAASWARLFGLPMLSAVNQ